MDGINVGIPMTRRFPPVKPKQARKDSKIALQIAKANDIEKDIQKVYHIFKKEHSHLSHFRYWELLRSVWVACGTLKNVDQFKIWMRSQRPHQYYFSTPEELIQLNKLPHTLQVYRACNTLEDGGISWTLSVKYAEDYKKAFNKTMVVGRLVSKTDVFAFINRRGEDEIIIL